MCSFQRRHIRIDTQALYRILCKIEIVPTKDGKRMDENGKPKPIKVTEAEFFEDKIDQWNLYFDVEKILELVHYKKEFDCQICSDGVSVSIMYKKPKVQPVEITDQEVIRRYGSDCLDRFIFELGVDPGMRTWNAAVRRNILTSEEVILFFYTYIFSMQKVHS